MQAIENRSIYQAKLKLEANAYVNTTNYRKSIVHAPETEHFECIYM